MVLTENDTPMEVALTTPVPQTRMITNEQTVTATAPTVHNTTSAPGIELTGCGGSVENINGTVASPNYPNNYDNGIYCEWVISVPSGRIQIEFLAFDLEFHSSCVYDKLLVRLEGS